MNDTPNTNLLVERMATLADAIRLRILHLLDAHELSVAELTTILQLPQSSVSRHLKQLSDQGWVVLRKLGTSHAYRMITSELDAGAQQLWNVTRDQSTGWPALEQDRLRLAGILASGRDSKTFFATAAGQWDQMREDFFGNRFSIAAMLSLLPRHLTVVDLGCGTGSIVSELANHINKVIGVDNSADMLKTAQKRVQSQNNVELMQGELDAIPLQDQSCDATLCILSLSYTNSPDKVLTEMHRLLKPGGKAIIVDILTHDRDDFRRMMNQTRLGFAINDLQKMLEQSHLNTPTVSPLPPEHNVKGPALFIATAIR